MTQALSSAPAASSSPPRTSAAAREIRQTAALLGGAIVFGLLAQLVLPHTPWTNFAIVTLGALAIVALVFTLPGKLKDTLGGFRFTATLLILLSIAAVLGTLILQKKPMEFYETRYASVAGLISFFHLDDIFHSMWFMGLLALFVAGLLTSSIRRLPISWRNLGFHLCHAGLIVSLLGAGISTLFSVRARLDLRVGQESTVAYETNSQGYVMENGQPKAVPLGFGIKLDQFGVDRYHGDYRLTFWEPKDTEHGRDFRMRASFDPVVGERHRLPAGASFTVDAYYPDFYMKQKLVPNPNGGEPRIQREPATASQEENNPAVLVSLTQNGRTEQRLLLAKDPSGALRTNQGAALAFDKRAEEVKTFKSTVTVAGQGTLKQAEITVNDPLSFSGWTFYQANYNPNDPSYSGLDVVKDPGVNWVFAGFALLSFGVIYIFNVQPRLRRKKARK